MYCLTKLGYLPCFIISRDCLGQGCPYRKLCVTSRCHWPRDMIVYITWHVTSVVPIRYWSLQTYQKTSHITFIICLSSALHDKSNSYSIVTALKSVTTLLVNIIRSEFNSLCKIRILNLYKIFLITVWSLGSAGNKYKKYFLGLKCDWCEGVIKLTSSCDRVLKCKSTGT